MLQKTPILQRTSTNMFNNRGVLGADFAAVPRVRQIPELFYLGLSSGLVFFLHQICETSVYAAH